MQKLPPVEKVYEAWTAAVDTGRVTFADGSDADSGQAAVTSSDGAKTYTVRWSDSGTIYSSNDNATYWKLYAGYPIMAVLMLQGRLPLPRGLAELYAGVNWTEANAAAGADYAKAVKAVEADRNVAPVASAEAAMLAADTVGALADQNITIKRSSVPPSKKG